MRLFILITGHVPLPFCILVISDWVLSIVEFYPEGWVILCCCEYSGTLFLAADELLRNTLDIPSDFTLKLCWREQSRICSRANTFTAEASHLSFLPGDLCFDRCSSTVMGSRTLSLRRLHLCPPALHSPVVGLALLTRTDAPAVLPMEGYLCLLLLPGYAGQCFPWNKGGLHTT